MAKQKYYAVKVGKVKGVFDTWNECKEQVDGYPGAVYKSFSTKGEAEAFMGDTSISSTDGENESSNLDINNYISKMDNSTVVAFVDGSYDKESKVYGYGVVLVSKDGTVEEIVGSDNNNDYVDTHNIAGEVEGVQNAITHAVGKGYQKIAVFYDYIGIEKWAVGEWQANSQIAKDYVVFMSGMKRIIEIEFYKVKAHSGIEYNEKADRLAKRSLLTKGIKNNSNGCVTVTGIDEEEFRIVFDLLKQSNGDIDVKEAGKSKNSTNFILSFNSSKIVVSCYKKGTTTIQGKQSKLLEELMVLIVELLPSSGEVVELLNDYHEINIEKVNIEIKFNHFMPNFDKSKTNDQKLINTLNQAVYNTMLKGERPDYTDLATPSLRAIEYYLYKIVIGKGILKADKGTGFGCFEPVKGCENVYQLQKAHEKHFQADELSYVNELYNFYFNNRHTLNHWDKDGLTRTLNTIEEARALIISNLELLDKYYSVF